MFYLVPTSLTAPKNDFQNIATDGMKNTVMSWTLLDGWENCDCDTKLAESKVVLQGLKIETPS